MSGDAGLRIGLLGPLLVMPDGVTVRSLRGRVGVLLAALALSPGRPVGAARLAGLIWDDEQPERARSRLHTVVARLRELLPSAVVTVGDGYMLDVDPQQVDVWRFRSLVRAARQAKDPAAALGSLDEALALCRGEPLADLRSAALSREVLPAVVEEYLSAVEHRAGFALAAGRHEQVITELRGLTGGYRLREPLWALLLRALALAGRPAEAIEEYHAAREVLAAELGVDPSAELQEVYHQLLLADQATTSGPAPDELKPRASGDGRATGDIPRRLPADTRAFTGRQAELARLLEMAETTEAATTTQTAEMGETARAAGLPGTVAISAIDGMAGIGKTALAVHTAHTLADRFSDGQLFIDLHGYSRGYPPRAADQALSVLLRALGVPPPQIPDDVEERAALYRDRLAGTRTLIVLDNAADEAQVRPLIPGEPGCLVLLTSRRKLKALDDAHTLSLDVLPELDAVKLLAAVAGPGRVTPDAPGVAELARLCGRLPLAVRSAATLLRHRPALSPEHLVSQLWPEHSRLAVLSGGDRDLADLFALSSQALDEPQRRLYQYLGMILGPETDVYVAAALLDTVPAETERLLQDLIDHNLLLEPALGRYRMHDLIRAHARDQARAASLTER